jgi:hypothetical protein
MKNEIEKYVSNRLRLLQLYNTTRPEREYALYDIVFGQID